MVLIEARHSNLKVSSNCQIINILDNYAYINFVLYRRMAVSYIVSNYVAISVNVQNRINTVYYSCLNFTSCYDI